METGRINTISFIGSGNIASHLSAEFSKKGKKIVAIFSRDQSNARLFAEKYNCIAAENLKKFVSISSDLIVIAVPDDELENVLNEMPPTEAVCVHTSGFKSIQVLSRTKNYGVFYPLQSFSGLIDNVSWKRIPICIEASDVNVESRLIGLAKELSQKVILLSSEKRKILHLAAVMVNNFSNLLYSNAYELLNKNELDFDLLKPLISETARKINFVTPDEAQTGPARRKDLLTINEHLKMLQEFPDSKEIYQVISDLILRKKYE